MKRIFTLLLIVFLSIFLINIHPSNLRSYDKTRLFDKDKSILVYQEDDDKEGDEEKKDDGSEKKDDKEKKDDIDKEKGTTSATDGSIVLKSDDGLIYKTSDNRFYISSRQQLWIEAKDESQDSRVGVGVKKIEVKIDKGDFYEYIGNKTKKFSVGIQGTHNLTYRTTDNLNNQSKPQSIQLIVDDTPPVPELEYQVVVPLSYYTQGNLIYVPKKHKIVAYATDTGAGVKNVLVSQNNGNFVRYKVGDTFKVANPGLNVIKVKARDNVLNESSINVYNIYVDVNPPTIEIIPKYALLVGEGEKETEKPKSNDQPKDEEDPKKNDNKDDDDEKSGTKKSDDSTKKKTDSDKEDDKGGKADKETPIEEIGQSIPKKLLPGQEDDDKDSDDKDSDDKDSDDKDSDDKDSDDKDSDDKDSKKSENDKKADEDKKAEEEKNKPRFTSIQNLFHIRAFDTESGIASIEYRIDGGKWIAYKKPVKFESAGKHSLEVRATDNVGNVNTLKLDVIVDTLPPKTKVSAETGIRKIISSGGGKRQAGIKEGGEGDGSDSPIPRHEE